MSDQDSINVWDRQCEADRFHLNRTLTVLGASADRAASIVDGPGRYSVMMVFEHLIAPHADIPIVQATDEDAVRTAIHTILDDYAGKGILDVPIRSMSAMTHAIVLGICDERRSMQG